MITKVCLRLNEGDREESMAKMKDFLQRRSFAQPLEFPSCGSVFRIRPVIMLDIWWKWPGSGVRPMAGWKYP